MPMCQSSQRTRGRTWTASSSRKGIGENSWIQDKKVIYGEEYNKEDCVCAEVQRECYHTLGSPADRDLPHFNGWVPWRSLYYHLKGNNKCGARVDENIFWSIMACTVNNKDQSHATYIIKEVAYGPDQKGETHAHILLKQRPFAKGYRGTGGKRQRQQGLWMGA